jgi:hypothetical protein
MYREPFNVTARGRSDNRPVQLASNRHTGKRAAKQRLKRFADEQKTF